MKKQRPQEVALGIITHCENMQFRARVCCTFFCCPIATANFIYRYTCWDLKDDYASDMKLLDEVKAELKQSLITSTGDDQGQDMAAVRTILARLRENIKQPDGSYPYQARVFPEKFEEEMGRILENQPFVQAMHQ